MEKKWGMEKCQALVVWYKIECGKQRANSDSDEFAFMSVPPPNFFFLSFPRGLEEKAKVCDKYFKECIEALFCEPWCNPCVNKTPAVGSIFLVL